MFQLVVNCQQFLEELNVLKLTFSNNNISLVESNLYIMDAVHHSSKILDYNND